MTLKEFAERLNGAEYNGYPVFSKEDIGIAKENGFVIVTGTSDDLMEFEGAIEDEAGCFNGGKVYFSKIRPKTLLMPYGVRLRMKMVL